MIDVTYEMKRCIHAADCVRGLPKVFDTAQRPWIQPTNATADAVADVVMRCPTGALQFERHDDGTPEPVPAENRIVVTENGPLHLRGDIELVLDGETLRETRLSLCRCGRSANKPFCDNSHKTAGFSDAGAIQTADSTKSTLSGKLTVTPKADGPLLLRGDFELRSSEGETTHYGEKAALCRCGESTNRPFCDGTHKRIDFKSKRG
jgi:CDGSH-type Zn-finger protein/uncharacterized Fe-S cluster protein YjdI